MSEPARYLYEFGPFRLDPCERTLTRAGQTVPLTPKAFDMLLLFVARPGRLVAKEELRQALWPDSFVEDANLPNNVWLLRKSLGDMGQEYIKTEPKRGYRFIAPVRTVPDEATEEFIAERHTITRTVTRAAEIITAEEPAAHHVTARTALAAQPRARAWVKRAAVLFACVLALGAGAGLYHVWVGREARRGAVSAPLVNAPPRSIAVVPFAVWHGDSAEDAYLGPGLADALITRLSGTNRVVVRPTSAVGRYINTQSDPVAIGREQEVDAVLTGTVQRAGARVRLTAQLVRVSDGGTLWSGQFDERFTDIFTVQDAIAQRVMSELLVELSPQEQERFQKRGTENAEAYQAYLKGRYFWNKRTKEGFDKAAEYFNQAIALDPNYAQAYAGLADVQQFLAVWGDAADANSKARAAARRAIELDGTLAEPHASLGLIAMNFDWDWATAEKEYRRAIALNPNYATAHHWYAEYLAAVGRADESVAEIGRARALDPLSVIINSDTGKYLYFARRYDQAIAQFQKTLELDADFFDAHFYLGLTYAEKGLYAEAVAQLERVKNSGDRAWVLAGFGYIYGRQGRKDAARQVLKELRQLSSHSRLAPVALAVVYAELGEEDQALVWLEQGYNVRCVGLTGLKSAPAYDSLRPDPRFADLIRRVGFPT
jgi:DNA-binding winged helix-turn-helix (wHTH) protein/TolB-like protein